MKKIMFIMLSIASLAFGMQNAVANTSDEIKLGRDFFYVGSPNPVTLIFDKLTATHTYDVICVVKALDANNFPVKLGFYVEEAGGGTAGWEKTFNDEHQHAIFFPHVNVLKPQNTQLVIKVLEGKGTANPVDYNCYAEDRA